MKVLKRIITVLIPALMSLLLGCMSFASLTSKDHLIGFVLFALMIVSVRSTVIAIKGSIPIDDYCFVRIISLGVNLMIAVFSWLFMSFSDIGVVVFPVLDLLIYIIVLAAFVNDGRVLLEIVLADPLVYYTFIIVITLISMR